MKISDHKRFALLACGLLLLLRVLRWRQEKIDHPLITAMKPLPVALVDPSLPQSATSALFVAIDKYDVVAVHAALEAGADVNSRRAQDKVKNSTALQIASEAETPVSIVKCLIEKGADVNAVDKQGSTALHYAALDANKTALSCLLAHHAKVDAVNILNLTPLHLAAGSEELCDVTPLLAFHAKVDARDVDGKTPLMYAVGRGHIQAVRALLKQGANFSLRSSNGETALAYGIRLQQKEAVKILKQAGVKE